jgi:hypothetical protein
MAAFMSSVMRSFNADAVIGGNPTYNRDQ